MMQGYGRAVCLSLFTLGLGGAVEAQASCPRADLPAYAHNDYRNVQPLHDALRLGYRGVEADVHLVSGALRIGHDPREAAGAGTLEAIYLAPLRALAHRCAPASRGGRPILLTIELKDDSRPAFDSLVALLDRYRELLGGSAAVPVPQVEVVLVGWHPPLATLDGATASLFRIHHRLARAGPLPAEDAGVRLLSLDHGKTIGRWWVPRRVRRRWLAALRRAGATRGTRLLRVHNVPADPAVYRMLLAAGVDLIGATDLEATLRLLRAP